MGIKAVYFSGGGEPTLYPKLKDYIVKLHDAGIETAIITNGSYFEKAGLIDIADMLNYIAISVPAIDPVTFKKITGSELLENVLSLPAKIKSVHKDKSPILGARIVLTNLNYMYVPDFMTVLKDREYDYALFKVIRDYEDNGQGLSDTAVSHLKSIIAETKNVDSSFTNINTIFDYRKKPEFKNKCWGDTTGCIIYCSVVCCEGTLCPQKHTLRVYYILLRGCLLCLFFSMAVEGPEDERTEVKHPRFLYVDDYYV